MLFWIVIQIFLYKENTFIAFLKIRVSHNLLIYYF